MSKSQDNPFDKIKQQTNMTPDEIYNVADSVKNANFSDEKTVRDLVRRLAKMAGKPMPKAKEDQIVQTITNSNMPTDMHSLSKFFKK